MTEITRQERAITAVKRLFVAKKGFAIVSDIESDFAFTAYDPYKGVLHLVDVEIVEKFSDFDKTTPVVREEIEQRIVNAIARNLDKIEAIPVVHSQAELILLDERHALMRVHENNLGGVNAA